MTENVVCVGLPYAFGPQYMPTSIFDGVRRRIQLIVFDASPRNSFINATMQCRIIRIHSTICLLISQSVKSQAYPTRSRRAIIIHNNNRVYLKMHKLTRCPTRIFEEENAWNSPSLASLACCNDEPKSRSNGPHHQNALR